MVAFGSSTPSASVIGQLGPTVELAFETESYLGRESTVYEDLVQLAEKLLNIDLPADTAARHP